MTIAEVAKRYGMTTDTLRYYERVGLLPAIGRTASGIRNYSESDCEWVSYIKCMRSAGVSVDTLVEYVRLCRQGPETIAARKQLLVEELNEVLRRLDKKLDGFEERMVKYEENLK